MPFFFGKVLAFRKLTRVWSSVEPVCQGFSKYFYLSVSYPCILALEKSWFLTDFLSVSGPAVLMKSLI